MAADSSSALVEDLFREFASGAAAFDPEALAPSAGPDLRARLNVPDSPPPRAKRRKHAKDHKTSRHSSSKKASRKRHRKRSRSSSSSSSEWVEAEKLAAAEAAVAAAARPPSPARPRSPVFCRSDIVKDAKDRIAKGFEDRVGEEKEKAVDHPVVSVSATPLSDYLRKKGHSVPDTLVQLEEKDREAEPDKAKDAEKEPEKEGEKSALEVAFPLSKKAKDPAEAAKQAAKAPAAKPKQMLPRNIKIKTIKKPSVADEGPDLMPRRRKADLDREAAGESAEAEDEDLVGRRLELKAAPSVKDKRMKISGSLGSGLKIKSRKARDVAEEEEGELDESEPEFVPAERRSEDKDSDDMDLHTDSDGEINEDASPDKAPKKEPQSPSSIAKAATQTNGTAKVKLELVKTEKRDKVKEEPKETKEPSSRSSKADRKEERKKKSSRRRSRSRSKDRKSRKGHRNRSRSGSRDRKSSKHSRKHRSRDDSRDRRRRRRDRSDSRERGGWGGGGGGYGWGRPVGGPADAGEWAWGTGESRSKRRRGPSGFDRSRGISRSPSRSRSRSSSGSPAPKIDKKKLFEIARKNASAMLSVGTLQEIRKLSQSEISSLKAGGKSVDELVMYCKRIQRRERKEARRKKKEAGEEVDTSSSEDSQPDAEAVDEDAVDFTITHPYQLAKNAGIIMNIPKSQPIPVQALSTAERAYREHQLRVEFPVSSGKTHSVTQAIEWKPVDPDEEERKNNPQLAIGAPDQALAIMPAPKVELAQPDLSLVPLPPIPEVRPPDFYVPPPGGISGVVQRRLDAQKRLAANPTDGEAKVALDMCEDEMSRWAASKNLPGAFSGSTGLQCLSASELAPRDKRFQAWASADQLRNARSVDSGVGLNLLRKMGWTPGEGLGKSKTGSLEPLTLDLKFDRRGLVAEEEAARFTKPIPGPRGRASVVDMAGKNPISALMEICAKRRWDPPSFDCTEMGAFTNKRFLWKVTVNGVIYQPDRTHAQKKIAKAQAAQVALQSLGLVPRDPDLPVIVA